MADFVFCSEGCYEDCFKLLANFESNFNQADVIRSLSFEAFAEEWRKIHFELVFSGRQDGCEMVNFSRQIIDIAKSFLFIPSGQLPVRIGALYLCYGLFYKQECNAQIRLTMEECQQLWLLVHQMSQKGIHEPHFILFQLFVDNAFEFSAVNEDHSVLMSRSMRQNQSRSGQQSEAILPPAESFTNLLNDSEMFSPYGLDQLAALQAKYNETKQLLLPQLQTQSVAMTHHSVDWTEKLNQIANAGPSASQTGYQATSPTGAKRKIKKRSNEDQ